MVRVGQSGRTRLRRLAGRLQSRRHAAGRDRHRARPGSAAEAAEWARLLRETVRQLEVSDVNMEEGSLRVDANVSVRPEGSEELGTKTELKNMNSFRFLERGVEAELARQRELVESGGVVEQETLHFDPGDGSLTSLRSKEEAHDYRYFPEPDLVPLAPTAEMIRGGPRFAAGAARGADRRYRGPRPVDRDRRAAGHRPGDRRLLRAGRRRGHRCRAQGGRQLGHRRARRRPPPGRRGGERRRIEGRARLARRADPPWSRPSRSPTAAPRPSS